MGARRPDCREAADLRYLLGKYVRRNRIPIAVAAAVLVALIGGTIFEFYLINRERSDAIESRRQEAKARAAAEAATKVAQLRERRRARTERPDAGGLAGSRAAEKASPSKTSVKRGKPSTNTSR